MALQQLRTSSLVAKGSSRYIVVKLDKVCMHKNAILLQFEGYLVEMGHTPFWKLKKNGHWHMLVPDAVGSKPAIFGIAHDHLLCCYGRLHDMEDMETTTYLYVRGNSEDVLAWGLAIVTQWLPSALLVPAKCYAAPPIKTVPWSGDDDPLMRHSGRKYYLDDLPPLSPPPLSYEEEELVPLSPPGEAAVFLLNFA